MAKKKRKPDIIKAIWIEWRNPETKAEKPLFGQTRYVDCNTARIFINKARCHGSEDAKTFWHELVHVFCNFYSGSISPEREEDIACRIERIIHEVLR